MFRHQPACALWTLSFFLLSAALAHAQPSPSEREPAATHDLAPEQLARDRYRSGVEAYREERYKDAIDLFLEADAIAPSAALSFNTAKAYEHLGDSASALRWYRDYLRRAPDADDRKTVEEAVNRHANRLRDKGVQQVTIMSEPRGATVLVDGEPKGVTPWTGELNPGEHQVSLRLRGYADAETAFTLAPSEPLDVALALEEAAPAPEAPARAAPAAALPASSRPPADRGSEPTSLAPYYWTALGVGTAALGGALAFELMRGKAEEQARDAPVQVDAQGKVDTMESRQLTARILAGVGGAFVVTGGVLLTVDLLRSDTQVAAACTPTGCGAVARGRFW